ncbi:MAG: 3'-5' exonuclease [Proteobacteria bacterium]|nr:3'-5' exonuclease [Pseudomonadota bacterium]
MSELEKLEAMAAKLAAHPDYRVLRRLDTARQRPALAGSTVRRAAIVDTETTGTDSTADKVIELALVVFEYCHATGTVGRVLETYDALEDPGMPIPPSSTAIHGITDAMVVDQRIDDVRVSQLLESVGIVIAHNAGFDRKFLEPRLPVFATLPWGCSWQEVPWSDAGIASSKLEYLAYRCGFFYDGHRAEVDCRALLEVLAQPLGESAGTALKSLLDSARAPSYRLWANNSPFETKDVLRQRGYWWDAGRRCWSVEVRSQEAVQEELAWLRDTVYAGKNVELDLDEFDARSRYSTREGRRTKLRTK